MTSSATPSQTSVDLSGEKDIHWSQDISYGSYLKLNDLLDCQTPLSSEHDEMLFIIIHQSAELWMKCCIHELMAATNHLKQDNLGPVFKMLSRVKKIQSNLQQSWEILSTLTPSDYASFRDSLGQSSGFQSFQYRTIEFLLGNKNPKMVDAHKGTRHHAPLISVLNSPSFYDECLKLLARRGYSLPDSVLDRDWAVAYSANTAVEDAWLDIYQHPEKDWELYELAEKLVDLEQQFHLWRFSHMKTVERIIGHKKGTGGTGGVSYLVKALDMRFFPELWSARTRI